MDKSVVGKVVSMRKGADESWDVRIDRASIYGNPFNVEEHGRNGCIKLYREYFRKRMRSDRFFRMAVNDLRGKVMGCWCKPEACHGDVIMEYLKTGNVRKTFPKEVIA